MKNQRVTRNMAHYLDSLKARYPAIAILGARQVGKTTLAKSIAPEATYLDMEKNKDFDLITSDPAFYFEQNHGDFVIDEAQMAPELFKALRSQIDSERQRKGRFILTGSSSPTLLNNISETLAGRIAIIELGTLKANEFYQKPLSTFYNIFKTPLNKKNIELNSPTFTSKEIQNFWLKGGYPEPTLSLDKTFYREWMTDYELTYINRDIAHLFPKLNKIAYRRFITMLGKLSSKIINKSDLARSIGISQPAITEYLDIADGTFMWRQLLSYENNISKSIVKMPRGHIRDSGLLHHLLHIDTLEDLHSDPIAGFSFEAFIIEEILKGMQDSGNRQFDYYYFRTRSGSEVDLILEGNFGVLPIEIKLGSYTPKSQLKSLQNFINDNKLPFGILINLSDEMCWLTETILQVPAGCL